MVDSRKRGVIKFARTPLAQHMHELPTTKPTIQHQKLNRVHGKPDREGLDHRVHASVGTTGAITGPITLNMGWTQLWVLVRSHETHRS